MHDTTRPLRSFAESDHAEVLELVRERSTSAALWRRPAPAPIDLTGGAFCHHVRLRGVRDRAVLEDSFASLAPAWLLDDLDLLVARYRSISEHSTCVVRLDRTRTDGCRLFHVDNLDLRMLCTYAGPGTELLPNDAARRGGLGKGSNDRIVRDASQIVRATAGDVVALKGARFGHGKNAAVIHRSPPLSATGTWRLYACVDGGDVC